MDITPEIRQAIERSGDEPIRLEDPLSFEKYVLMKASTFERIERILAPLVGEHDDWHLADAYAVADEAFREGWEAPGMSDYDEYEKHRP
jgi:hypothetical protein